MYQTNNKNAFQLEHCWRILRNEAKWLILRDTLKARKKRPAAQPAAQPATQPATQSCHTFASSINLDENNDEMNSNETLERPKARKQKRRN